MPAPTAQPPARRPWAWVSSTPFGRDPVIAGLLGSAAVLRLYVAALTPVRTTPDTHGYRHGFLEFDTVSFSGRTAIRPWGITTVYALLPDDRDRVMVQALVAVVAWSLLAVVAAGSVRRTTSRRVVSGCVLAVGLAAQVLGWDSTVMSESLSISTGLLSLVSVLLLTRRPTWPRVAAVIGSCAWFSMTRPLVLPMVLAWLVGLLLVRAGSVRQRVVVTVGLTLLIGYVVQWNRTNERAWQQELGYSRATTSVSYALLPRPNPYARQVLADLHRSGMPACALPRTLEEFLKQPNYVWAQQLERRCPGADRWFSDHWFGWWAGWLARHPGAAVSLVVRVQLPAALTLPVYADTAAALPSAVGELVLAQDHPGAQGASGYRADPLVLWLSAAGLLGLAGRRWGRRSGSRRSWPAGQPTILWLTAAAGLGTAALSGLVIQVTRAEAGRESAAPALLLRLSLLILALAAAERLIERRNAE